MPLKIPTFKLEIHHKPLANCIKTTKGGEHYSYNCGFLGFFNSLPHEYQGQRNVLGRNAHRDGLFDDALEMILYCIDQGWMNAEWLRYYKWHAKNKRLFRRGSSMFKTFFSPYLYRGIPPAAYKDLLFTGNTAAKFGDENDIADLGFTKADWMFAVSNLPKAWEYAHNHNPSIIVVYKKRFFYNLKQASRHVSYGEYRWARKDKNMDFRKAIVAIIRVRYL
jgi:hypothetical protein